MNKRIFVWVLKSMLQKSPESVKVLHGEYLFLIKNTCAKFHGWWQINQPNQIKVCLQWVLVHIKSDFSLLSITFDLFAWKLMCMGKILTVSAIAISLESLRPPVFREIVGIYKRLLWMFHKPKANSFGIFFKKFCDKTLQVLVMSNT